MNTHLTGAHPPSATGFLGELYLGRMRWDLIHPFPDQDEGARRAGDDAVADLVGFLTQRVDPQEVETNGRLPDGLIEDMVAGGYLKLGMAPGDGGLGLSEYNTFRLIEAASSWSIPAAYVMALHHGLGASAYLPMLPDGPLRDLISLRSAAGFVSGDADTEPIGAVNRRRTTTATPTPDGEAYLISGEKVYIQNGPIADLLRVSATVRDGDQEHVRLFFVDTATPGFEVVSWHEYMGLKGLPNGVLRLDGVRVPRDHMLTGPQGERISGEEWRRSPELREISVRARMHSISAPALAIAKLCAHWSRDFVNRRGVDGRPLGEFDEIQRMLATTLAETFAIDSVARWILLAEERANPLAVRLEQTAAKNINSLTCWRIVDRTMSLLAAEGFETAQSKARRGAPPLPVERAFRDARALRIAGGVDFQVDNWSGQSDVFAAYYRSPETARVESGGAATTIPDPGVGTGAHLAARNAAHLAHVTGHARTFATTCLRLSRRHPDPETLFTNERLMILLNRVANELFAMSVVLSRASTMSADGYHEHAQGLADVYCTAARHRVADAWHQIDAEIRDEKPSSPDHARLAGAWLADTDLDFLLQDVVTELPQKQS